jgi:predicted phosphodiesterase
LKIVVFSDVHGNLTALETVLEQFEAEAPDQIIFAGDLCLFGPRPAECLALLRGQEIVAIYGNTDEWIDRPPLPPEGAGEEESRRRQPLIDICHWTQEQLEPPDIDWLNGRPFEVRVSPTQNSRDDLLVVHANPLDVHQVIWPTEDKQRALFGKIRESQSDDDLALLLGGIDASMLAFGHLHVPNIRQWRNLTLANISSVSLAGDGDVRAKYGILTWSKAKGWSGQIRRVPYELERELAALARERPPNWKSYSDRLQKAGM